MSMKLFQGSLYMKMMKLHTYDCLIQNTIIVGTDIAPSILITFCEKFI